MSIEEYKKIVLQQEGGKRKSAVRQLQGKINRELGKNFEEQIEAIAEIYKFDKMAIVEKTPEPMKILKHIENGRFETVFLKSAQPDFKGTIKGGRTVVFDAKFTESTAISYQALSDHQREVLMQYDELGAMAFVLVGFADGNMYKIDIKTWRNMKEIFGHKHIKQQEMEEHQLKAQHAPNGMIDFLGMYPKKSKEGKYGENEKFNGKNVR